jgi:riboflavin kinase / FMN adenylyltransferase
LAGRIRLTIEPSQAAAVPTVLTLGVFDGVHLGHRALISAAVAEARARGLRSAAMTFAPHPAEVLAQEAAVQYLSSLPQRKALIRAVGAEIVVTLHFTREVASLTAEEFMADITRELGVVSLWVGPDFALGRGRQGNMSVLAEIGSRMGYSIQTVPAVVLDGAVISSSTIRALLLKGMIREATAMLGRPYTLEGEVRRGDGRGRHLGFPTANLQLDPRRVIPANGVYVVRASPGPTTLAGVANVGTRPSFGVNERNLEVHLLDFAADLYGQHLRVEFLERLRPEMRFGSTDELVAQMHHDAAAARAFLAGRNVEEN